MARILVTGGCGFLGSHLVDKLVNLNHTITVIDNLSNGKISNLNDSIKKIKLIKADISKNGQWKKYFRKIDVVIHLAAIADIVPSINNPTKYFNVNVKGTLNILENCREFKVKKIIYAASSSSYGIPKNIQQMSLKNLIQNILML